MIIAMPVEEKTKETGVCPSFGRTPYFMIYDTEKKEARFLDNSAIAATGGAGIKASQAIVDEKAATVLTPRLGSNALDVLDSAGVKVYRTAEGSAMENIDAFLAGRLAPLTEVRTGAHGGN